MSAETAGRAASAAHLLVVDDDDQIRRLLRRCFESEGYRVSEAATGRAAREAITRDSFDLITLDLNLPDTDGLSVARDVRAVSQVPIIMVTGKGETIDRVVGLELGADDYISKPFHVREVLARVRAVLRRFEAMPKGESEAVEAAGREGYSFEGWKLDIARRSLTAPDGCLCELTTSEFDLLVVFLRHANRVLSRDHIMDQLRGHDWAPNDRSIDNLVVRLRRKVEPDADSRQLIKTVRGVGYTFAGEVRKGI